MLIREGASAAPSFLLFFRVFGSENNKKEAILVIFGFIYRKNNNVEVSAGSRVHFFSIQGQELHKKADLCNFGLFLQKNVHVASLEMWSVQLLLVF